MSNRAVPHDAQDGHAEVLCPVAIGSSMKSLVANGQRADADGCHAHGQDGAPGTGFFPPPLNIVSAVLRLGEGVIAELRGR